MEIARFPRPQLSLKPHTSGCYRKPEEGAEEKIVEFKGRPGASYYENIVAHLNTGEPLLTTGESARRVVAVLELAEKSSKTHQAETVPYEFE